MQHMQHLLAELAHTPSLICTVGRANAIGELFLREPPRKIEFNDTWAAIECTGWHLHVNLAEIARVRFVEEAGYDQSISPVAVFEDSQESAVLRFYFPHASQTHTTYTAEELALFGKFKARYEKVLEIGD